MRRRAVSHCPQTISSLLGLAPGGGYLATHITARAGGLLHHLFTITTPTLPPPNPKDLGEVPVRAEGVLFVSVALIRQVHASRQFPHPVLSDAVLYGVRTFLDPDNAGPRLPNQPEVFV